MYIYLSFCMTDYYHVFGIYKEIQFYLQEIEIKLIGNSTEFIYLLISLLAARSMHIYAFRKVMFNRYKVTWKHRVLYFFFFSGTIRSDLYVTGTINCRALSSVNKIKYEHSSPKTRKFLDYVK